MTFRSKQILSLTIFIILISFLNSLSAQVDINEPCGFDAIHKDLLQNDPAYRQKSEDFETYILKNKSSLKTSATDYKGRANSYFFSLTIKLHKYLKIR